MAILPPLPNNKPFNTKDMMLMLSKSILAKNLSSDEQANIPTKYVARFAQQSYALAKAGEKIKNPDALIQAITVASALKDNIGRNPKTKIEYKSYLAQLDSGIQKADEQLNKLKNVSRAFDESLIQLLEKHRDNVKKLTRPGVTMDSAIMENTVRTSFKEGAASIEQYEKTQTESAAIVTQLQTTIAATQAVVPQHIVKEANQTVSTLTPGGDIPTPHRE